MKIISVVGARPNFMTRCDMTSKAFKSNPCHEIRKLKATLTECDVKINRSECVSKKRKKIAFRSAHKKFIYSDLLKNVTPENIHTEIGYGEPAGTELL